MAVYCLCSALCSYGWFRFVPLGMLKTLQKCFIWHLWTASKKSYRIRITIIMWIYFSPTPIKSVCHCNPSPWIESADYSNDWYANEVMTSSEHFRASSWSTWQQHSTLYGLQVCVWLPRWRSAVCSHVMVSDMDSRVAIYNKQAIKLVLQKNQEGI